VYSNHVYLREHETQRVVLISLETGQKVKELETRVLKGTIIEVRHHDHFIYTLDDDTEKLVVNSIVLPEELHEIELATSHLSSKNTA
jgi:hypothetical protein